jgi:hypothetical protein
MAEAININNDLGPIRKRVSYWAGAVGTAIASLAWNGFLPREIRVFKGGNLNVTYWDGTTEIITGIPDNTIFVDCCWASIAATNSTYNLTVGW